MIDRGFWVGKRVFLTGHTGFKGSWLSLWLQDMGANVCGYALEPPTDPSMFEAAKLSEGMQSIISDIRNYDALYKALDDFKPEIVFHMAAQPLVRLSYACPVDTYAINVMGTVNLLDCLRRIESAKAIINITSDKCYENREWYWGYRESDPKGGYDPYSNSKGCSELVTDAFRASYFNYQGSPSCKVALASARAGNVIGGGDWALDRLVPDLLKSFETNNKVEIRNPSAIRPWQHVLEPLSGYLLTAQKLFVDGWDFAQGWNFGPREEDAQSVQSVVSQLTEMWGENSSWYLTNTDHPHEAAYLKLDCSKAKMQMGWYSRWPLSEALKRVVLWHKAWMSKEQMREYSLNEIKDYVNTKKV